MRHLATRDPTQHRRLPTLATYRESHIKRPAPAEGALPTRRLVKSNRQIHHQSSASLRLRLTAEPHKRRVLIDVLDLPPKSFLAPTLDMQRSRDHGLLILRPHKHPFRQNPLRNEGRYAQ